jgi:hypothetical protein
LVNTNWVYTISPVETYFKKKIEWLEAI